MRATLFLSALLALFVASAMGDTVLSFYGTSHNATATWYQASSIATGACSIPVNDMNLRTVAVATSTYNSGAMCGMCIQVTGYNHGSGANPVTGTFTAMVADRCPECGTYNLDLRDTEQLDGVWDINWVAVDCPVDSLKLDFKYQFQGSNPYYVKIKVVNPRIPVKGVQAQDSSGNWVTLSLTEDGWFEKSSGTTYAVSPIRLRITSVMDETVEDSINLNAIPTATRSDVYAGNVQFAQGGGNGEGTPGSGGGEDGGAAARLHSWLSSFALLA